jgi:hypothetical protein
VIQKADAGVGHGEVRAPRYFRGINDMDLRAYYRKLRETETSITEDFPIVKSLATEEGGRAGRLTEVPRVAAARMLLEGSAELATAEETRDFRAAVKQALEAEEQRRQAAQIHFTILSEADLQSLQRSPKASGKNKE